VRERLVVPGVERDATQEATMDKDRIKGSAKNIGGKIKEGFGKAVGDKKIEVDGKAEQVEGKLQNAYGSAKDKLRGK
jgi:uncharacterized protein YjbJ (UPF0337 family)